MTQQEQTQEMVSSITDFVNSSSRGSDFNELMAREHRTLQQSFTRLCLRWLEHISQDEYKTDLRNEKSKEVAKELISKFKENNAGFVPSDFLGYI